MVECKGIFGGGSGNPLADRRYDFALSLAGRGDHAAASDLLRQGLELAPHWPPLHFHLGEALGLAGDPEGAVKAFAAYLTLDPVDRMGANLKLALLRGETPDRLPPAYVRGLFDQYAARFDSALVEGLKYKTPGYMADAILSAAPGRRFARACDLGCGTGLALAPLRFMIDHAEGVDLSPAMIEQASGKNIYDGLSVAGIEDYLAVAAASGFDLILAADVFVYFGSLDAIFSGAARALRPGGLFCFSVQTSGKPGYALGPDHRYTHNRDYIEAGLTSAGLAVLSCRDAILRQEAEKSVAGLIVTAQKP